MLCVVIRYSNFVTQIVLVLATECSCVWPLWPVVTFPPLFLFEFFLIFRPHKRLRTHPEFSLPQLWNQPLLQRMLFGCIREYHLESQCGHDACCCYWSVTVSRPSHWTELWKYMYVYIYLSTHISLWIYVCILKKEEIILITPLSSSVSQYSV